MSGNSSKWLLGAAVLFLAACGSSDSGSSGPPIGPPEPPVVTVPAIVTSQVFPQLAFAQPVLLQQAPGDSARWFVAGRKI